MFYNTSSYSTTWYGDFWCPAVEFLRFERTHFHPDRLNLLECRCEWTRNIPVSETKYQHDNVGGARRIWFTTAVQLSASVMHGSWKRAQAHSHGIDYKARGGKNEKTKTTVATIAMQCHSPQTGTPTTAELRPTPNQLDTWLSPQFTPVRIIIVTILAAYAKQTKLAICPSFILVSLGGAEAQSPASCGHIYRDRKD